MVCRKYADYRFLSTLGDDGDLHLADLNVKNISSSVTLCKNNLAAAVFLNPHSPDRTAILRYRSSVLI